MIFRRILEIPIIYSLSQILLAPGWHLWIKIFLKNTFKNLELNNKKGLDIGCGPSSLVWQINNFPDGLDLSNEYIRSFNSQHESSTGYIGSSDSLPFESKKYDYIISIGLLHHLNDNQFKLTVSEMERVCKKNGHIIILDAVLPKTKFLLIPYLIRKLDRGEFVRNEEQWRSFFDETWSIHRKFYSLNLLEALIAIKKV